MQLKQLMITSTVRIRQIIPTLLRKLVALNLASERVWKIKIGANDSVTFQTDQVVPTTLIQSGVKEKNDGLFVHIIIV